MLRRADPEPQPVIPETQVRMEMNEQDALWLQTRDNDKLFLLKLVMLLLIIDPDGCCLPPHLNKFQAGFNGERAIYAMCYKGINSC